MSTNGNGNQVMVSSEPQTEEVGLTQVITGEGKVETLLVTTTQWGVGIVRPTARPNSEDYSLSADELILSAIKKAVGIQKDCSLRALVSLQIRVEVIDFQVDKVPGAIDADTGEVVNARSHEFAVDVETACNFIGIHPSQAPVEGDSTLDKEIGGDLKF